MTLHLLNSVVGLAAQRHKAAEQENDYGFGQFTNACDEFHPAFATAAPTPRRPDTCLGLSQVPLAPHANAGPVTLS